MLMKKGELKAKIDEVLEAFRDVFTINILISQIVKNSGWVRADINKSSVFATINRYVKNGTLINFGRNANGIVGYQVDKPSQVGRPITRVGLEKEKVLDKAQIKHIPVTDVLTKIRDLDLTYEDLGQAVILLLTSKIAKIDTLEITLTDERKSTEDVIRGFREDLRLRDKTIADLEVAMEALRNRKGTFKMGELLDGR